MLNHHLVQLYSHTGQKQIQHLKSIQFNRLYFMQRRYLGKLCQFIGHRNKRKPRPITAPVSQSGRERPATVQCIVVWGTYREGWAITGGPKRHLTWKHAALQEKHALTQAHLPACAFLLQTLTQLYRNTPSQMSTNTPWSLEYWEYGFLLQFPHLLWGSLRLL